MALWETVYWRMEILLLLSKNYENEQHHREGFKKSRGDFQMSIKILIENGMTFWAKENNNVYSRNIKELLDFLGIKYLLEDKSEKAQEIFKK